MGEETGRGHDFEPVALFDVGAQIAGDVLCGAVEGAHAAVAVQSHHHDAGQFDEPLGVIFRFLQRLLRHHQVGDVALDAPDAHEVPVLDLAG